MKEEFDYMADFLSTQKNLSGNNINSQPINTGKEKEEEFDYMADFLATKESSSVIKANQSQPTTSVISKILGQPLQRSGARVGRIGTRIGEEFDARVNFDPSRTIDNTGTNVPSVLLQTVGEPLALGFDVLGQLITVGAEGAFGLLPDDAQEGVVEFLQQATQTEVGQQALSALNSGAKAWENFSKENPNDAANFETMFNITFGVPNRALAGLKDVPDVEVSKISTFGSRKAEEPLAGRDKDIYDIAFVTPKGNKTTEQILKTTDPNLTGTKKQLATEDDLITIDELKKAGVSKSKTAQENLSLTLKHLEKLEDSLLKLSENPSLAKKTGNPLSPKIEVSRDIVRQKIQEGIRKLGKDYPVFTGASGQKKLEELYRQLIKHIEEEGYTAAGLIKARRKFDNYVKQTGIDVGETKVDAGTQMSKVLRNATNEAVFEVIPEAREILKRQSSILKVQDNLIAKAGEEANGLLGRYIQTLGLDKLVGDTAFSFLINIAPATGLAIVASPFVVLKNLAQSAPGANMRAKVSYALRDVYKEINNKLNESGKVPVQTLKELAKSKPVLFSSFKAAADQLIMAAEEQDQKQEEVTDPSMFRSDGSKKSARGFLGSIKNNVTGGIMTEVSVDLDIGGQRVQVPTLVPTLTKKEIEILSNMKLEGNAKNIPKSIIDKAAAHAKKRMAQGKSPFYIDGE
tara:strand:+ start:719 stop:2782 length:2064 start_codon:yes stop_codon:yes gene_type:complete